MGYYTDYELYCEKYSSDNSNTKHSIAIDPKSVLGRAIDDEVEKLQVFEKWGDNSLCYYGNAKWCDSDKDMLLMSIRFPDVLFTLHGIGEESDDMWFAYYLNGEHQIDIARIEYDGFCPEKLEGGGVSDHAQKYSCEY